MSQVTAKRCNKMYLCMSLFLVWLVFKIHLFFRLDSMENIPGKFSTTKNQKI